MTEDEQIAAEYASHVSTKGRVLQEMFIGDREFTRVTDVVHTAFLDGLKLGRREGPLTFDALIAANLSRVERWHSLHDWSPLEWAGAMCGEAGEAANFAKKFKRVTSGIPNKSSGNLEVYRKGVGMECADAIIYSVLLCASVDVDLVACIREAFNVKSEEYGFPERL